MVRRFTDPFEALLGLQRALDASRTSDWFGTTTTSRGAYPPVNVFRQGDDFVVVTELPGIKKAELEIQIMQRQLRIAGKKDVTYADDVSVHRRERASGGFDRTLTFPVQLDSEGARAEYRDGILTLHVPRSPEEKPRSIAIE